MNHSPGPWTFHERSSHFQIQNEAEFPLAEVYGKSAFSRGLCEANARLIAAAPELLAAFQRIAGLQEEMDGTSFEEAFLVAENIARAAIALATGANAIHA